MVCKKFNDIKKLSKINNSFSPKQYNFSSALQVKTKEKQHKMVVTAVPYRFSFSMSGSSGHFVFLGHMSQRTGTATGT